MVIEDIPLALVSANLLDAQTLGISFLNFYSE